MRVTTHSDYALRVLIFAALQDGKPCRIEDIAARYRISKSHLTKVVWNLSSEGFLTTSRGRAGGLRLSRPPEEINLGAVMRATEDNGAMVECFDAKGVFARSRLPARRAGSSARRWRRSTRCSTAIRSPT